MPVFSYAFNMPVTGCSEGKETSFVFALPVEAGWAGNLASITLSGPGGDATLDGSTDRPMAILRDLQTGQVRGFLSDLNRGGSGAGGGRRVLRRNRASKCSSAGGSLSFGKSRAVLQ